MFRMAGAPCTMAPVDCLIACIYAIHIVLHERTVVRAAAGVTPGPGSDDVQCVQHAREEAQQREQNVDDQVT